MKYLNVVIWHNSVQWWLIAIGLAVGTWLLLRLVKAIVAHRLVESAKRTPTSINTVIVGLIKKTTAFTLGAVALYCGSLAVVLGAIPQQMLRTLVLAVLLLQVIVWGNHLITVVAKHYKMQQLERDASRITSIAALTIIARLILFAAVVLLALDNFGFDITALVAGLGIGGVAVALAVQNILGDLFSSLTIMCDKPFVVGDFIIVGEFLGTVEHIGLKTTRLRSLSGEQLILANGDLLGSRIRNYKRMQERRAVIVVRVVYQTPYEQLVTIPLIIRQIIEAQPDTRFDRAHFCDYGDCSLNFEVVYYMLVPDYHAYMDTQQAINLAIFRRFAEEGITFAYPTRTVFLEHTVAQAKADHA